MGSGSIDTGGRLFDGNEWLGFINKQIQSVIQCEREPMRTRNRKIIHIARSFKEAEEWDILQQIQMTPEERQKIALKLKRRLYGPKTPDIREYYKKK